jgi:hypothetical protein
MLVLFVRLVGFLRVLGPHGLEPMLEELFQIILRDRVLMIDVGLGEAAPEEIGDLLLGQLTVFIRIGLSEERIDPPLPGLPQVGHAKCAVGKPAAKSGSVPSEMGPRPHVRATRPKPAMEGGPCMNPEMSPVVSREISVAAKSMPSPVAMTRLCEAAVMGVTAMFPTAMKRAASPAVTAVVSTPMSVSASFVHATETMSAKMSSGKAAITVATAGEPMMMSMTRVAAMMPGPREAASFKTAAAETFSFKTLSSKTSPSETIASEAVTAAESAMTVKFPPFAKSPLAEAAMLATARAVPASLEIAEAFASGPLASAITAFTAVFVTAPFGVSATAAKATAISLIWSAPIVTPLIAVALGHFGTGTTKSHWTSRSAFAPFSAAVAAVRKLFIVKSAGSGAAATSLRAVVVAVTLRQFFAAPRAVAPPVAFVAISVSDIPLVAVSIIATAIVRGTAALLVGHLVGANLVGSPAPIHVGRELHQTGCRDPA